MSDDAVPTGGAAAGGLVAPAAVAAARDAESAAATVAAAATGAPSEHLPIGGGSGGMHAASAAGTSAAAVAEVVGDAEPMPVPHAAAAWEFWRRMGAPKYHVAPMVDQSELPYRMLCRANGATCAYSPMYHARLFHEDLKYRAEFTTCPEDRPLLVQFCANDPGHLLRAAKLVEDKCDAVDINFGCPQRIAKRGFYGAFLMDDLELVEKLVRELVAGLKIPVTCKIRIFPEIEKTLAYAKMIERAGCSVLAVHGRTRDQKNTSEIRADWEPIRRVKAALSIPVLANGNVRHLGDAAELLAYTKCDGVLSAESLLVDPSLFSPSRLRTPYSSAEGVRLLRGYLTNVLRFPVPMRMVKGHVHKLVGGWLSEFHDLRDLVNRGGLDIQGLLDQVVDELDRRVSSLGRTEPVPTLTERARQRLEAERAKQAAIEEQDREAAALAALDAAAAGTTAADAAAAAGAGTTDTWAAAGGGGANATVVAMATASAAPSGAATPNAQAGRVEAGSSGGDGTRPASSAERPSKVQRGDGGAADGTATSAGGSGSDAGNAAAAPADAACGARSATGLGEAGFLEGATVAPGTPDGMHATVGAATDVAAARRCEAAKKL